MLTLVLEHPESLGRHLVEVSTVAGDDAALLVHQYRVGEPELFDACRNLCDLLVAVGAAVSDVGDECFYRQVGNLKFLNCRHF